MEGWKNIQFGRLGTHYGGLTGKTKDDFGKGMPYIPYVNVFNNSKINLDNLDSVNVGINEKQNVVKYGDILFTTSSETLNEVGMTSVMLDNVDNIYLNSFCFGFRLYDFDTLLPEYARYLFRSHNVRHAISLHGKGSTRFNIAKTSLFKDLYIDVPESIDEQIKIANILSTVDSVIEQTEELIAKYRNIKQGLMHDLLTYGIDTNGNIRNPKTHKFETKNGLLVPSEWEVENIGLNGFVTKLAGFEYTKYFDYAIGGEIIALRGLNLKNGRLELSDVQTIPKSTSEFLQRSKLLKGDIVISYVGTVGELAVIEADNKYHLAPNVARISFSNKLYHPEFVKMYLMSERGRSAIDFYTSSTTQAALSMGNIRKIMIAKPCLDEQIRISRVILKQDKLIEKEEENLSKYKKIKQGLMHDLLAPIKRVKL